MKVTNKKVALVVGAGDNIGAAIARKFANQGYVICVARRNAEKLRDLVTELEANSYEAHAFELDTKNEEQVAEVFEYIESNVGPIEVMVFNVGTNVHHNVLDTTSETFQTVWQASCLGGFLTGKAAASYMVPREKGSIFFTGATASLRGAAGFSAFSCAKAGLRMLAQSLARELGPSNIHVSHVIVDAILKTERAKRVLSSKGVDINALSDDTFMQPSSVADAFWYLHQQPRDGWTFEMDLRPNIEKW